jgi:hypothetical protein
MQPWLKRTLVGIGIGALAVQLIPYGHDHAAHAVAVEPTWSSTEVRALAKRACFDCHSNETQWLWYTNIAPFSWLIQNHVDEGRRRLNFSELGSTRNTGELSEAVNDGEMPPWDYAIFHAAARLSAAEKAALAEGLLATAAQNP